MAVIDVNRGGVDFHCITPSEVKTWRMFYEEGLVQDLFEADDERLYHKTVSSGAFEAATREELIAEIDNQGLYFDSAVETI